MGHTVYPFEKAVFSASLHFSKGIFKEGKALKKRRSIRTGLFKKGQEMHRTFRACPENRKFISEKEKAGNHRGTKLHFLQILTEKGVK